MSNPKLSIIIPVYNAEATVRRCVDSVLAQTFTDFECILINDGSTDSSGSICDEYAAKDSRVRVFHKENGGVSSARNIGLDNAKGEWICFIDADDDIQNLDAISTSDLTADIILFALRFVNSEGISSVDSLVPLSKQENTKENYLKAYIHYHIFNSVCAKLIRRNIIGELRFDPTIKFGEDALFCLRLMKSVNRIAVCNKVVYTYYYEDYGMKYQTSIKRSVKTMKQIFDAYWALGCRNLVFERNVFNCYRAICANEWAGNPAKWYENRTVASIYTSIKDAYPLSFRIKYMLVATWVYRFYKWLKEKI
ncbi:MAG: glycosyltransferase family 2 protein [Candidatus Cryptobacteroides sp.]